MEYGVTCVRTDLNNFRVSFRNGETFTILICYGRSPPFLKNHENIGFLSNTGLDPLENHTATKPVLTVGPPSVWSASERPLK